MNKQVIVLGRGRSGTSIAAGILHMGGINMGDKLKSSSPRNPKGYFEDREIIDELLYTISPDEHSSKGNARFGKLTYEHEEFEEGLKEFAKKKKGTDWGWKLNKSLFFAPIIVRVLDNPYFVYAKRDIKDQTKSLSKLNQKSKKVRIKSILNYRKELKKFFDNNDYPLLEIKFDNWFKDTKEQIDELCLFVDIEPNKKMYNFINPNYRTYGR